LQSLLTRDDCRLVQISFAQIEPNADGVAAKFYERLFELDATLVPLFRSDLEQQGAKFMEKLAVAVMGLEDLESLAPLVQALGRSHGGYGLRSGHYATAREALLWALADYLGPGFNSELRSAWCAAFDTIAAEMIRAASSAI
jgi:hemoglobin-like flavoprotein